MGRRRIATGPRCVRSAITGTLIGRPNLKLKASLFLST
jgi:hypothetical protein